MSPVTSTPCVLASATCPAVSAPMSGVFLGAFLDSNVAASAGSMNMR